MLFMKKYSKLWKYMFGKYSNSGYSIKDVSNFDKIKAKAQTINLAEVQKFLIDYKLGPKVIDKADVKELVKLVNV